MTLFPKSLEKILGGFTKTVQELDEFGSQCATGIAERDEKIDALASERAGLANERDRAVKIRENLARILES